MSTMFDHPVAAFLWDESSTLALVLDLRGVIVEANARALTVFGTSVVGRSFDSLVAGTGQAANNDVLHFALPDGHLETLRVKKITFDDRILVLGELDVRENALLQREIIQLNDELHNLARELARKNEELKRLDEIKNRFLGMAAHDLRKPLGVVLNYAEFLLYEAASSLAPEHRAFLEIICNSATFMARLIDDFLDLAVIESGRMMLNRSPVDPRAIFDACLALALVQARRKGVSCQVDAPPLPHIWLDAPKMEQVLNNLMSNAIEHSPPGTQVLLRSWLEESHWVVAVSDQGTGVAPGDFPHLFKPFETGRLAKTAGERSTGLGLAIAKSIVEAHGGSISAQAVEGAGTIFSFRIPVQGGATK